MAKLKFDPTKTPSFVDPGEMPTYRIGRPVLATIQIPTAALAERYSAGESIDHLADDYGCERLDIDEAIRCELRPIDAAA